MTKQHKMNPEMPYERLNQYGKEALTNAELIAILLRTGSRRENVMELARKVLSLHENPSQSLSILYDVTKEELMSLPGIGEVKAIQLIAVLELSKRLSQESKLRREEDLVCDSPSAIAEYYMETMRHEKQEKVMVLLLDNKLTLIHSKLLTIGTANASLCSPRDVFMAALKEGAVNIILMHNHPSGDPTPSRQDIELTHRLEEGGKMLEIRLVDHLIIGDLCYTSMKEQGYL